jgi:dTDP-4-amino-4,6-dideoxygalactose transaminase
MYPSPINDIEEIKATFKGKDFPAAEMIAEKLLTVPTHHLLSEKDKKSISELFREAASQECRQPSASSVVSGMV